METKPIQVFKLLLEVKRLWAAACEYDGIDRAGSFVVFSTSNPYSGLYNAAMTDYLKAARRASGIPGLSPNMRDELKSDKALNLITARLGLNSSTN